AQASVLGEAMALQHPGAERRVRAEQAGARDAVGVVGDRRAGQDAERERAAEVHRERPPREAAPDAPGYGGVEHEPAEGAEAADEPDAEHDERAHAARTTFVTSQTATAPTAMLAAAYPAARP